MATDSTPQKTDVPIEQQATAKENDPKNEELRCFNQGVSDAMIRLPWLKQKVGDIQRMETQQKICFLQEFQTDQAIHVWGQRFIPKAFVVYGFIRNRYNTLGGGLGILGCPTCDEASTRDQIGRYNDFENGAIYWTTASGAVEILEPFLTKWKSLNGELGYLKYPTSSGIKVGNGLYQTFQGGKIWWSPSSTAFAMSMPLASMYDDVGGPNALGFPVTDETPMQNPLGTIVRFQKGKILWNALVHPQYNFSVDGVQCSNSGSDGNEASIITATVAISGHDPVTVTRNLDTSDEDGYRNCNLEIKNISLGDEEVAIFSYAIAKVDNDDTKAKMTLETSVKVIAVRAAEVESKTGRPAETNIIEALRGIIGSIGLTDDEWVSSPSLNPVTEMVISAQVAALRSDNSGLIVATTTSIGGKELRERFDKERLYQRIDTEIDKRRPGKIEADEAEYDKVEDDGSKSKETEAGEKKSGETESTETEDSEADDNEAESGKPTSVAYSTTWRIVKSK